MDIREIKSIIEALLFTWGDPLDIKDISKVLDISKRELSLILQEMMEEFDYSRRGVKIIRVDDSYQLSTRSEHYEFIKELNPMDNNKDLSNAALETLSIIAYKQPVIKSTIEDLRGVKSDGVLRTLVGRNLIEETGRLDRIGRPIIYGTTDEFLRAFGLQDLKELPLIKGFDGILKDKVERLEDQQ